MGEDLARGQDSCNCDTANLFLCDMDARIQSQLNLRGFVNGAPTEILPVGEVYEHPNTIDGSINDVELAGSGVSRETVFPDISVGSPIVPEEVRTIVGVRECTPPPPEDETRTALRQMIANPATPETMRIQYRIRLAQLDEEDMHRVAPGYSRAGGDGEAVYTLGLTNAQLPDGEVNVDRLTPEQIFALSEDLGGAFGVVWNNVSSVYTALGGRLARSAISLGIRLEQTFQSIGSARVQNLSAVDHIRLRGVFLREILTTRVGRVAVVQGRKVISFRGYAGLRVFMTATYYPAKSIAVIDAGIISRSGSALTNAAGAPFRGVAGKFLIFGGIIEVADWMTQDGERFLSDLLIDLGVMVAVTVLSSIGATAAVMAGLMVAGVAAPALVVGVAVGAVAIGVGWLIMTALERTGVVEDGKASVRSFLAAPEVFYDPEWHPIQSMGPLEGIEYLNNADPEEFDYIMGRAFGFD